MGDWLVRYSRIDGIVLQNWMFVAAGIVLVAILYIWIRDR
jgi:hypothetical protein